MVIVNKSSRFCSRDRNLEKHNKENGCVSCKWAPGQCGVRIFLWKSCVLKSGRPLVLLSWTVLSDMCISYDTFSLLFCLSKFLWNHVTYVAQPCSVLSALRYYCEANSFHGLKTYNCESDSIVNDNQWNILMPNFYRGWICVLIYYWWRKVWCATKVTFQKWLRF